MKFGEIHLNISKINSKYFLRFELEKVIFYLFSGIMKVNMSFLESKNNCFELILAHIFCFDYEVF
jgi:hypothetical protein